MHREFETRLTLERRRAQPTLQIFISLSVYCRPKGCLSRGSPSMSGVVQCSSLSSRLILDDTSPRSPIASSQLSGCLCGHVDVYRIPRITIPPPVPSHFPQASGVCCVYVYTPATGSTLNLTRAERVGLAAMPLPVCCGQAEPMSVGWVAQSGVERCSLLLAL